MCNHRNNIVICFGYTLCIYTVADIERMGDHAVSIAEAAQEMQEKKISFSAQAKAELAVLDAQRQFVQEIPELPGGYYTSRCIDNAFRAVVYQYKNERVELEKANDTINRELQRKREELS